MYEIRLTFIQTGDPRGVKVTQVSVLSETVEAYGVLGI